MKRMLHLAMGILGMLLAIALAVTVTLNSRWLYIAVMESENLESTTGYSRAEILDNYDAVINYNSIFGPNTLELPSMDMSEGKVLVRDNGDNSLTIENLTDKTIPTVRVFYKYFSETFQQPQ